MDVTFKMLNEFHHHVMDCLNTWTNENQALVKIYIENDVREMYENILKDIIVLTEDGLLLPIDQSSFKFEPYTDKNGFSNFTYSIEACDTNLGISASSFIEKHKIFYQNVLSDEFITKTMIYMIYSQSADFTLDLYIRIFNTSILVNNLYKLRNEINSIDINNNDSSEMLASSMFCSTLCMDLSNGLFVKEDHLKYNIIDMFGKYILMKMYMYVDTDGRVCLANVTLK